MAHSPANSIVHFGFSFVGVSLVSMKLAPWGFGLLKIYVPARPILFVAIILGLLVIPLLIALFRAADAATEHLMYGEMGYLTDDEVEERILRSNDAAIDETYGWMFAVSAHPVSVGVVTGGVAGISISLIKIMVPLSLWLTAALCLAVTFVLLLLYAMVHWRAVARLANQR